MRVTKKPVIETLTRAVGRRLREAHDFIGLSQIDLARRAGVRQEALSKFERGGRGLSTENLLAVLRAAAESGVSVDDYVLRGTGSQARSPLVFAQNPAVQGALSQLYQALHDADAEGGSDETPSEPKIPSHKRRKPFPAPR